MARLCKCGIKLEKNCRCEETDEEEEDFHTRRARARHEGEVSVSEHIGSTPPILAQCFKCRKWLLGTYSLNNGRPACEKHS